MRKDSIEIGDAEAFGEELGELIDAREQSIDSRYETGMFAGGLKLASHRGIVFAHVCDAA
jgi:hypothetical protein